MLSVLHYPCLSVAEPVVSLELRECHQSC